MYISRYLILCYLVKLKKLVKHSYLVIIILGDMVTKQILHEVKAILQIGYLSSIITMLPEQLNSITTSQPVLMYFTAALNHHQKH